MDGGTWTLDHPTLFSGMDLVWEVLRQFTWFDWFEDIEYLHLALVLDHLDTLIHSWDLGQSLCFLSSGRGTFDLEE
jgi:hypothetical protein